MARRRANQPRGNFKGRGWLQITKDELDLPRKSKLRESESSEGKTKSPHEVFFHFNEKNGFIKEDYFLLLRTLMFLAIVPPSRKIIIMK